jgi:methylmalonyl-CoA/ethylmalonyl-CoA epimerase
MNRIEHIGIAVRDLSNGSAVYSRLLGVNSYKTENVPSESVITEFFKAGDNKVELLESTDPASTIAKFIEKRGEGLHHIAFEVDDIVQEMARLQSEGFTLLSKEPKLGADNKMVCFVHPKDCNGVLIELCQQIA